MPIIPEVASLTNLNHINIPLRNNSTNSNLYLKNYGTYNIKNSFTTVISTVVYTTAANLYDITNENTWKYFNYTDLTEIR
jgi:hypothetical protein